MLTKDEAELYDRQIRLWGVNAQSRLRQSKVLMLGFNGLASEVAKILILAGIDTLTIVDDQKLNDDDLTSNLFCRTNKGPDGEEKPFRTHQVQEKLRTLNPLVNVHIENTSILDKASEDFKGFDLVTLQSILTIDQTNNINDICRKQGIKFYLVIDYGFFGFMFNDLGAEFKFTYEEFDHTKKELSEVSQKNPLQKQSGGVKDPINVDDETTDANQESPDADDDDDRENGRPKKRMRLEEFVDTKKTKDLNEMKHCAGAATFVTFGNMISFKGTNFDRKTSPILFLSIAMIKFYSENKYLPLQSTGRNFEDDLSELNKIIASMRDELNLNEFIFKKLHPDWSKNITGSLSPVCAIVGGVAGQDMIRALSGKDIPICNTFSFDGIEMSGVIEKVGIESKKDSVKEPIVRDFLQIEDSN